MIDGIKPYPEYTESGLPWLGEFPAHWELVPNRALMQEQRKIVGKNAADYTLLSLTLGGVIPRNMETPKGKFPAQFNTYKVVRPEDLVFCLFDIDETPRGVGHSKLNGMITGAYDVFTPKARANARYLYLYYLFLDEGKLLKPLYTGLRKTIRPGDFASLKTPCPKPDEQDAIVRFLDHANGRIERAIRAKKKLIALLHEQKQAIIHRAVTRGFDPNVPLKPSGIPWLGECPANWKRIALKRLLSRIDYGTSELSTETGSIRILTMGNIQKGEVIVPHSGGLDDVPHSLLLEHHDLLFTRTNGNPDLVGKVGIFRGQLSDRVSFASYLVRLRTKRAYDPQWLHMLLNSSAFWPFARSHALVNLQTNLNSTRYAQFPVPVPPPAEQKQIVEWVAEESKTLNAALKRAAREIELLREYQTRLVADVVTGKLDVGAAARDLPAYADDPPTPVPDESEGAELIEEEQLA